MTATQHFDSVSGTLNTVLANRNGIVIASDSRGTWRDGGTVHHDDSFQKLFRTAGRSALAIAGLLATPPEPYKVETASKILARFGANGIDDGRGDLFFVTGWVESQFGIHLRGLAAVLSTFMQAPRECRLFVTIAGYDKSNSAQISQIQFSAGAEPMRVNGKPVWLVTPTVTPLASVEGLAYRTAGITRVADAILAGRLAQHKPAVATYLKAWANGLAGELGMDELVALTEVIFEETIAQESAVGGDLQIAAIPADGEARWKLKLTEAPNIRLGGAELVIGGVNPSSNPHAEMPAHYEMVQNFDSLNVDGLYVATHFKDLVVPVDENQFFGCTFERCTFEYLGSGRLGFDWNTIVDCQLDVRNPNAPIPSQIRRLQADCIPVEETGRARARIPKRAWVFQTGGRSENR